MIVCKHISTSPSLALVLALVLAVALVLDNRKGHLTLASLAFLLGDGNPEYIYILKIKMRQQKRSRRRSLTIEEK